ncbi:MAG TPA: hypothetical protein VMV02_06530 [Acidimicrobiales bacterium]|nr:hypothetical protein [Acidimicrobiales bacterium]
MADGIKLSLRRTDMVAFRTIDEQGRRPIVHVAGRHADALRPGRDRPSV